MKRYNHTLKEDFDAPLDDVQRAWIRKPVVVIFTILFLPLLLCAGIVIGMFQGFYEAWISFYTLLIKDCWEPDKDA